MWWALALVFVFVVVPWLREGLKKSAAEIARRDEAIKKIDLDSEFGRLLREERKDLLRWRYLHHFKRLNPKMRRWACEWISREMSTR